MMPEWLGYVLLGASVFVGTVVGAVLGLRAAVRDVMKSRF